MPIESVCTGCGQKLRVDEQHAGKLAKCPRCQTTFTVPLPGRQPEEAAPPSVPVSDQWFMRTEDGMEYGPVTKRELDRWYAEGRIAAGARLRQGTSDPWQAAATMYPALSSTGAATSRTNPFAGELNPYMTPSAAMPASARRYQPHRGGMLLGLGIVGLFCCTILSPFIWVMGNTDLNEIRAGRMDPSGKGLTQAGMILGIIGTVLLVLNVVAVTLSAVVG